MDLTIYYQKIRNEQSKLTEEFPVIVSVEQQDGGKAGVMTEVPRAVAARMIVDGVAKAASADEAKAFRKAKAEAKKAADDAAAAARLQFSVVPNKG